MTVAVSRNQTLGMCVCVCVCCLTAEEKTRKKKAVKKIRLLVVRDVGRAGGITRERGGRAAHAATPAE